MLALPDYVRREGLMQVNVENCPQLKLLCWNRPDVNVLDGQEAFDLYERNWRFVDTDAMPRAEHDLLDRLTQEYGHGVLLAA